MTTGKFLNRIPNYRNIYKVKNRIGTPENECICEFCHKRLTVENRSVVSLFRICIDYMVYQHCKDCRKRFYGRVDNAQMLKWAHGIVRRMKIKSKAVKMVKKVKLGMIIRITDPLERYEQAEII